MAAGSAARSARRHGAGRARAWIADFGVKAQGEDAAIASLSGGNAQHAVLARERSGEVDVLVAANPAFDLHMAGGHAAATA